MFKADNCSSAWWQQTQYVSLLVTTEYLDSFVLGYPIADISNNYKILCFIWQLNIDLF